MRRLSTPRTDASDAQRLLVQHNLSMGSLLFAKEIGGLPCPSLALTRLDSPVLDFGEITLIGDVSLASPAKGCALYTGDAYVKRAATPWGRIDRPKALAAAAAVSSYLKDRGLKGWDDIDTNLFYRKERLPNARGRVTDLFKRSLGFGLEFFARQGVDPLVKAKSDALRTLIVTRSLDLFGSTSFPSGRTDLLAAALGDEALVCAVRDYLDKSINGGRTEPILCAFEINEAANSSIKQEILKGSADPVYDKEATARKISDLLMANPHLEKQFSLEIYGLARSIVPAEYMKTGERFTKIDLDTMVRFLRAEQKGSEVTSSTSLGSLKALTLRRLNSEAQLEDSMHLLGNPGQIAESEAKLESMKKRLVALMFDHGLGSVDKEHSYSPLEVLKSAVLSRNSDELADRRIEASFLSYGVSFAPDQESVRDEALGLFRSLVAGIRNAPVPYFEGKAQRAVLLSEFSGAVVPESLPSEIKDFLRNQVGKVATYEPMNQEARRRAIASMADLTFNTIDETPARRQASSPSLG